MPEQEEKLAKQKIEVEELISQESKDWVEKRHQLEDSITQVSFLPPFPMFLSLKYLGSLVLTKDHVCVRPRRRMKSLLHWRQRWPTSRRKKPLSEAARLRQGQETDGPRSHRRRIRTRTSRRVGWRTRRWEMGRRPVSGEFRVGTGMARRSSTERPGHPAISQIYACSQFLMNTSASTVRVLIEKKESWMEEVVT